MKHNTDEDLMKLIHQKHRPALEELYDRYVNLVYSVVFKMVHGDNEAAKDIVQQVFLRIWTTSSRFDKNKGELVNWIIKITRNISIDYIRKERKYRHQTDVSDLANLLFDENAEDVLQLISNQQIRSDIQCAQSHLSPSQRRLIHLLYWEGYTLKEIANMENEPIGTIKSRLHQSLKKLHTLLSDGRGGLKNGRK